MIIFVLLLLAWRIVLFLKRGASRREFGVALDLGITG